MEKLLVKLLVHGVMITAILVGLSNATFASAVIRYGYRHCCLSGG